MHYTPNSRLSLNCDFTNNTKLALCNIKYYCIDFVFFTNGNRIFFIYARKIQTLKINKRVTRKRINIYRARKVQTYFRR